MQRINYITHFGRIYIIAPENAISGAADWTLFEEVWQYGSNLGEPNEDPLYLQDGVAPQTECQGLINANGQRNINGIVLKTGRAFIPSGSPKGFVKSHKISNYGWIFNRNPLVQVCNPCANINY